MAGVGTLAGRDHTQSSWLVETRSAISAAQETLRSRVPQTESAPLPQPSALTPPSLVLPLNPQVSPHLWHLFIVASCQYTACLLGLQLHPPPLHKFIIVAATCWWFQQLPISYCLHHCLCFVPLVFTVTPHGISKRTPISPVAISCIILCRHQASSEAPPQFLVISQTLYLHPPKTFYTASMQTNSGLSPVTCCTCHPAGWWGPQHICSLRGNRPRRCCHSSSS